MSRAGRIALVIGLCVGGFFIGGFHAPLRTSWLILAGRAPHCPWMAAINQPVHASLRDVAKDQILAGSRLVETDAAGFERWETPAGSFWIPSGNGNTLPFNLAEQQLSIYGAVQAGDVVLDCGANVGVFARAALDSGAGRVVAIEPLPQNLECLRRNFARELDGGRLILFPKGVWDSETTLTVRVNPENTAAASFVMGAESWQPISGLPLTTIDNLVAELKLDRVDFIKLDIEGAEVRALRGASATLARFRPRLAVSSYHLADDPVEIPKAVAAAWPGYEIGCGYCGEVEGFLRPEVLLFRAPGP